MRECLKPGKYGKIFSLERSGWGGKQRGLRGGSLKTGNHVAACTQGPDDVNELLRDGERLAALLGIRKTEKTVGFFVLKKKKKKAQPFRLE